MASIQGNKIKYAKREILKAKKLLAKVIPFDVWLRAENRTESAISMYWLVVNGLTEIISEE